MSLDLKNICHFFHLHITTHNENPDSSKRVTKYFAMLPCYTLIYTYLAPERPEKPEQYLYTPVF